MTRTEIDTYLYNRKSLRTDSWFQERSMWFVCFCCHGPVCVCEKTAELFILGNFVWLETTMKPVANHVQPVTSTWPLYSCAETPWRDAGFNHGLVQGTTYFAWQRSTFLYIGNAQITDVYMSVEIIWVEVTERRPMDDGCWRAKPGSRRAYNNKPKALFASKVNHVLTRSNILGNSMPIRLERLYKHAGEGGDVSVRERRRRFVSVVMV